MQLEFHRTPKTILIVIPDRTENSQSSTSVPLGQVARSTSSARIAATRMRPVRPFGGSREGEKIERLWKEAPPRAPPKEPELETYEEPALDYGFFERTCI